MRSEEEDFFVAVADAEKILRPCPPPLRGLGASPFDCVNSWRRLGKASCAVCVLVLCSKYGVALLAAMKRKTANSEIGDKEKKREFFWIFVSPHFPSSLFTSCVLRFQVQSASAKHHIHVKDQDDR